jgi:toxin ParE2
LGNAFLIEAVKVFHLIEQHPDAWHPLTSNIRRCRLVRYPYGVIYTPDGEGQLIIAVAHLHRAPIDWKNRLTGGRT